MPVFRTSTSKAIVAAKTRRRLKRIWARHQHEPDCIALCADRSAFRRARRAIKQQGYWTSQGEVDAELAGIPAPIHYESGRIADYMSLVFTRNQFHLPFFDVHSLGTKLVAAATQRSEARSVATLKRRPPPWASKSLRQ